MRRSGRRHIFELPVRGSRVPSAVPYGREVCGGAPVGLDVVGAFQLCLSPLVAPLEQSVTAEAMRLHAGVLLDYARHRFTLGGRVPSFSLDGLTSGDDDALRRILSSPQSLAEAWLPAVLAVGGWRLWGGG